MLSKISKFFLQCRYSLKIFVDSELVVWWLDSMRLFEDLNSNFLPKLKWLFLFLSEDGSLKIPTKLYWKMPQHSFFGESRTTFFFEIFWPLVLSVLIMQDGKAFLHLLWMKLQYWNYTHITHSMLGENCYMILRVRPIFT